MFSVEDDGLRMKRCLTDIWGGHQYWTLNLGRRSLAKGSLGALEASAPDLTVSWVSGPIYNISIYYLDFVCKQACL